MPSFEMKRAVVLVLGAAGLFACSSSDSASSADDGGASDAAPTEASTSNDGGDSGLDTTPITAPDDTWTWIDFPNSKCASGSPTGMAVNPHSGSTDLVIYMEGGGACSDATGCWGASPTAANLTGYTSATFATAPQKKYPILDRTVAMNPMSAMNMVYVPYCTGDMHDGTAEVDLQVSGVTKPTYFWGGKDIDMFLARLVPTFTGTKHVWSIGTSAGGFGSFLNFDRVARAFGTRVDILDDSGPPIPAKGGTNNANIIATWGVAIPSGCTGCNSLRSIFDFDRAAQPSSNYGFMSFASDTTISKDFGYAVAEFPAVLQTFSDSISADPHAFTYIVTNEPSHVVETDLTLEPEYFPWVTQMVQDDAAWKDGSYAHP
ncbi:MAG: pectin acetylesterase-family hydrolase [Polyangiaceae bacterium]